MIELLVGAIMPLLNKVIPDKNEATRLAHEIATLSERQAHELAKLQIETNKAEALSSSLFVGGWRPACGWVCTSALAFNYVLLPVISYLAGFFLDVPAPEPLDMDVMLPVLLGMLGLGGIRGYEKVKGVSRSK